MLLWKDRKDPDLLKNITDSVICGHSRPESIAAPIWGVGFFWLVRPISATPSFWGVTEALSFSDLLSFIGNNTPHFSSISNLGSLLIGIWESFLLTAGILTPQILMIADLRRQLPISLTPQIMDSSHLRRFSLPALANRQFHWRPRSWILLIWGVLACRLSQTGNFTDAPDHEFFSSEAF